MIDSLFGERERDGGAPDCRKRHAHANVSHVIAKFSRGEKKGRWASFTVLWVISCAHTRDNSVRGIGQKRKREGPERGEVASGERAVPRI